MERTVIGMILLALALAGSETTAQTEPANLKRGQELYEQHCIRCHGVQRDGLGPEAESLIVPPANFTSARIWIRTDGELLMAISDGVLFSPMHAWRDRLSEQEIEDIISYLRLSSPFNPIK